MSRYVDLLNKNSLITLPQIERLAVKEATTVEEIRVRLKKEYDGYLFAIEGEHVYNPFSLLNVFLNLGQKERKQSKKLDLGLKQVIESDGTILFLKFHKTKRGLLSPSCNKQHAAKSNKKYTRRVFNKI